MNSTHPLIDGVLLTPSRQIIDSRGSVLHVLRADSAGFIQFGECYCSEVFPGAIKAWKLHRRQTQNIVVPVGQVRFVLFDGRPKSRTFQFLNEAEIGRPDAYIRITIPPGIWYGFSCISEVSALLVNCVDYPHQQEESDGKALDDPAIPYKWV